MSKKRKVNLVCEIKTSFHEYDTEAKTKRAESQIKAYIKDMLEEHCSYVPLEIEEDTEGLYDGKFIDDCTSEVKFKIKNKNNV